MRPSDNTRGTGRRSLDLCLAALGAALIALAGAACTLESTSQLALNLELGDCTDSDFSDVSILSVEVYGANDDGSECALARRCIQVNSPGSIGDLRAALAGVPQPLVDVEIPDDDLLIVVTGHRTNDCFESSNRAVCGFADTRDERDGAVTISLNCSNCPTRDYPLCR